MTSTNEPKTVERWVFMDNHIEPLAPTRRSGNVLSDGWFWVIGAQALPPHSVYETETEAIARARELIQREEVRLERVKAWLNKREEVLNTPEAGSGDNSSTLTVRFGG